jgi:hypothetical protein
MTFVPGYEYDLFISYPREANADLWVAKFHSHLKEKLDLLLPGTKIFFDKSEYKAYNHRKRMLAAAGSSALFIPILAPAYVSRDKYTLKELDAFCTKCLDEERIIIIEIYPVSDQRPPALHGPNRNKFYNDQTRTTLRSGTRNYDIAVMRVAESIVERLKALVEKPRLTVFVAQVTGELNSYREAIVEDLETSGFTVLPEMDYRGDESQSPERLRADLDRADLMVQLLGQNPSDEGAPDQHNSRAAFQYDQAKDAGVRVLQWVSPSVDPSKVVDPAYKTLLEGTEVRVMSFKDFKRAVKEEIRKGDQADDETGRTESEDSGIYIAAHQDDSEYVQALKQFVIGLGFTNYEILDQSEELDDLKQVIETADAVVLLQGKADPFFIKNWLKNYRRLRFSCKKHPRVEALMYAPPPTEDKRHPPDVSFDGLERLLPPEAFPQTIEERLRRPT